MMPTEAQLVAALHAVPDPELFESIVDLGLIKSIAVSEARVDVVLIPTSATCPMGELLIDDARSALRSVCPAACDIRVTFDWDTEWHPSRMSPALQQQFGW
jgi:metal-sulfur cluster biosynthetic enzyme